jgi:hypothetical protein
MYSITIAVRHEEPDGSYTEWVLNTPQAQEALTQRAKRQIERLITKDNKDTKNEH